MTHRPQPRRRILSGLAVACFVTACSSPAASTPDARPSSPPTPVATSPIPSGQPNEGPSASVAHGPELAQAWATATLVDVTTGQPFRAAGAVPG